MYGRQDGEEARRGEKGEEGGREQDKNESERRWVDFPKKQAHLGTAAAALGKNLAAPWLAIATRLEQRGAIDSSVPRQIHSCVVVNRAQVCINCLGGSAGLPSMA